MLKILINARLKIASKLLRRGDLDGAERLLRKILSKEPNDVAALEQLAELASVRKDWDEAVKRWEQVLSVCKTCDLAVPAQAALRLETARLARGTELRKAGDLSGAGALLRQVLGDNSAHLGAVTQLAEIATARKDWDEAVKRWEQVLSACKNGDLAVPKQAVARLEAARFTHAVELRKAGDLSGAQALLEQVLGENAVHLNALIQLAEIAAASKAWGETVKRWEKVLTVCKTGGLPVPKQAGARLESARFENAVELRKSGDLFGAQALLEQVLGENATHLGAVTQLAEIATASKAWGEAVKRWEQVLTVCELKNVAPPRKIFPILKMALRKAGKRNNLQDISYEYVLASLSPDVGYGVETTGRATIHQPMAYGLVSWAAANQNDIKTARFAADWLVQHTEPQKPGWGLGWEWDAFYNGFINPADTVYGITTAVAVDGLLSIFCVTQDDKYLEVAQAALNYYSQFQCVDSGHILYSDQPADSSYRVPNITSMLMGQYARLGRILKNKNYQKIAAKAYRAMVRDSIRVGNCLKFKYARGLNTERENDLVHASYIVYGIYLYEQNTEAHNSLTSDSARHLFGFVGDDVYEFNNEEKSYPRSIKARSWGVGMLLYILSILNEKKLFEKVLDYLPLYEYENLRFSYRRGDELHCPRVVSHILLGLSLYRDRYFILPACR